jgi:hypothetical protein
MGGADRIARPVAGGRGRTTNRRATLATNRKEVT